MLLPIQKSPSEWNETDLQTLVVNRIPESLRLDYKREMKLDPVRERRELLKDVTAFANSQGGVIVYGVDETEHEELGNVAGGLVPLTDRTLVDRASQVISSMITPAIRCDLHVIDAAQGGYYLIAEVMPSRQRPHAFSWNKKLEWYVRRNQDNVHMTEPEIRLLYEQTASARHSVEQRYEALDLSFPAQVGWRLVAIPLYSYLELIDPLKDSGQQLSNGTYVRLTNQSNYLRGKIDRFEETRPTPDYGDTTLTTKLFRNGEFMVGYGCPQLSTTVLISVPNLAAFWYGALKYFGEIYSLRNYFGPIRVCFETFQLQHPSVKFTFGGTATDWKHANVRLWWDLTVSELADPADFVTDLYRQFGQGCGVIIPEDARLNSMKTELRRVFA